MTALLQCLSHTPLLGLHDPAPTVVDEVERYLDGARERVRAFDPELVVLFAPDHFNGFFHDLMPPFCLGVEVKAIGDFGSPEGVLSVPEDEAMACAEHCLEAGVDLAVSHRMQVDHGFAQPLGLLLGGLDRCPVIPVFINSVAPPMPGFQRVRRLGEAIGGYARRRGLRTLFIGSGGLSHEPPVPELASAPLPVRERLLGSGRNLPPAEREARTQRVIDAARDFTRDPGALHPLNADWDQQFMASIIQGRLDAWDELSNAQLSALAGKSAHESKTWLAAAAAMAAFGPYTVQDTYYREIPEWIAGFGLLSAHPTSASGSSNTPMR
ncbi:3-carboxyethylcatechol 2,3-dioxygenase [Alkalilimnicola sp. S0819]|uniref:3-carboxyethylcatechol 2,3-dioxygenase n=1 Tax=Alkalilimnicola sp. S0819 TaxID=2613922 RepID=UPI0012613EBD|nr:3-carboxyethylcatechol 2,3-dioxygenase [Alkalilimnicola sp. S0819]KAB7624080.1 3-carboxyethylcatechol 2,3-dioxygenase [Alkalilimnicola sp. S0819]MPQ16330.1 3-carboxyethylcatechol 2,3-dioxygenase [Alkalilimnicola sp. S0819]